MSDTATPTAEPSLEQQLEALKTPPPEGDGARPPETAPTGVVPDPAASPVPGEGGPSNEPDLETALNEIVEPTPTDKTQPALTVEQQQILNVVPTPEIAQTLTQYATSYHNFTEAFSRGDFDGVESMFQQWNPNAYDAFLEHVYAKKVANGEWVDRWISDTENPANKGLRQLQNQISQLKQQLTQRSEGETQAQASARQAQNSQGYRNYLDGLFEQIKFSPNDRRWVAADLHNRVATDPAVFKAVSGGNFAAVNGLFKQAVREYVGRDKQANAAQQAQFAAQAAKKAPLTGSSPVAQVGALPDDIKAVPKGKEDEWMDQQLAGLASKRRK